MAINPYMMQGMQGQNYGPYNPLAPYQQRLDQMQQQWGSMQPQMPAQPQMQVQTVQIKGWPVSGEEDARKAVIDFDGSVYLFPDLANGRVYTKQMNPETFAPVFKSYQLVEQALPVPISPIDTTMFAPKDEVDQLKAEMAAMRETIDQLTATPPTKEGKR